MGMSRSAESLSSSKMKQSRFADQKIRCSVGCFWAAAALAFVSFLISPLAVVNAGIIFLIFQVFLLPIYGWDLWRYSLQSSLLGFVLVYCLLLGWWLPDRKLAIFCFYLVSLSAFHFLEFFLTAMTSLETLDASSFLLDHSVPYWFAAIGSWMEFFVEYFVFPGLKNGFISFFGFCLIFVGELLRKLAMVHAQGGFTHVVVRYKRNNHVLVTDGVYAIVRHPGYLGWFLWCIGTQILLCNPLCVFVYALSSWFFFRERIHDEEQLLLQFFGEQYRRYQKVVPLGIPFIRGFCDS